MFSIVNKILEEIFLLISDIVIKNKLNVASVALVKFHWFGINWHVFNQSEGKNCCLYIIFQKIGPQAPPQAKSGKYFQIWCFPRFWGKMATFWACACKLSWTLLSPARVQPLYGARRKESSGTGLAYGVVWGDGLPKGPRTLLFQVPLTRCAYRWNTVKEGIQTVTTVVKFIRRCAK